ncbi:hypothetical protein Plhal304r1_c075g0162621 [Plasmopara halstedii]
MLAKSWKFTANSGFDITLILVQASAAVINTTHLAMQIISIGAMRLFTVSSIFAFRADKLTLLYLLCIKNLAHNLSYFMIIFSSRIKYLWLKKTFF